MPEITIDISDSTFRKMKTLAMLTGSTDIEGLILKDLDDSLNRKIVSVLGIDSIQDNATVKTMGYVNPIEGLSHDPIPEDSDDTVKRTKPSAQSHVLSVKDIESDDSVEDPKHEAVSSYEDSTTFADLMGGAEGVSGDDIEDDHEGADDNPFDFGDTIEIDEDAPPPRRVGAKPLPKGFRGRVGEYTGNNPVNPERE